MSFNPDPKKQAEKVIFSRKSKAISHHPLVFNNNNVIQTTYQKHLGIILDTWLSFEKHLKTMLCKMNKTIGLIRKLQNLIPRKVLITLYKVFVRLSTLIMAILFMIKPTMHRSPEIRVSSIQCLFSYYWRITRFIKGETIPRTRFRIFSTTSLV